MKVLQINSVCGIRSTGRICTDIADALIQEGHKVRIGYGRETVPEKYLPYAIRITSDFECKMHALRSRFTDRAAFYSRRATKKFIDKIQAFDPDVIHLHNLHGYYIDVKTLFEYLSQCQKRVIWTLHDCWAFTGHCCYFSVAGCEQWKEQCLHCPQKRRYPKSILLDRCNRNYREKKTLFTSVPNMTIVTPSAWLAALVKESYLNCYDIQVIHNGIATDIFSPTPGDFRKTYALENKKIVLGVSTVWDRLKGWDDFLQLAGKLGDDYRVVLVGLTGEQLKQLPQNIVGIERTNSTKELASIYAASDVFVNPTYEDNYPTVNLEAQACGTPVITYKTGGSTESVPGEYWVEQGNVDGLVAAIHAVLSAPSKKLHPVKDKRQFVNEYMRLYARGSCT